MVWGWTPSRVDLFIATKWGNAVCTVYARNNVFNVYCVVLLYLHVPYLQYPSALSMLYNGPYCLIEFYVMVSRGIVNDAQIQFFARMYVNIFQGCIIGVCSRSASTNLSRQLEQARKAITQACIAFLGIYWYLCIDERQSRIGIGEEEKISSLCFFTCQWQRNAIHILNIWTYMRHF